MADLTVSKRGGTITISVDSSPAANTTSYGTLPSYTSRNGNSITVSANTSYNRSFTLNVTATTNSDSAYQGTASSSSAWTVNQAGDLGPEPTGYTWYLRNNSDTYGLYGTWTASNGGSISGDLERSETESQRTPVPFNLTSFNGTVTGTDQPKTVTFNNLRSGDSATMTRNQGGTST